MIFNSKSPLFKWIKYARPRFFFHFVCIPNGMDRLSNDFPIYDCKMLLLVLLLILLYRFAVTALEREREWDRDRKKQQNAYQLNMYNKQMNIFVTYHLQFDEWTTKNNNNSDGDSLTEFLAVYGTHRTERRRKNSTSKDTTTAVKTDSKAQ